MSNVKDFGAVGDGRVDSTEAKPPAFNDGDGVLGFPRGDDLISRTIEIDLTKRQVSRTSIHGHGCTILDDRQPKKMKAAILWRGDGSGNVMSCSRVGRGTEGDLVAPSHVRRTENHCDTECFRLPTNSVYNARSFPSMIGTE